MTDAQDGLKNSVFLLLVFFVALGCGDDRAEK